MKKLTTALSALALLLAASVSGIVTPASAVVMTLSNGDKIDTCREGTEAEQDFCNLGIFAGTEDLDGPDDEDDDK